MAPTEFLAHLVFFIGPLVLALGWQHLAELPIRRWSHAGD